jgi:hypothetical protein
MKTRKELKEEYRQIRFKKGLFLIRNVESSKLFIGSSIDLKAIWHAQKLQLNFGIHSNKELQDDWNLLGSEAFCIQIVEEITFPDDKPVNEEKELKTLENLYILELEESGQALYNKVSKT